MSSKKNVVYEAEPEVPDVEPEVAAPEPEPVAPVVTRAEALVAEAAAPEPEPEVEAEPEVDYAEYLAAEAARRAAWIHG